MLEIIKFFFFQIGSIYNTFDNVYLPGVNISISEFFITIIFISIIFMFLFFYFKPEGGGK